MSNERKKPLLFGESLESASERGVAGSQIAAQRATEDPNWIPGDSEQLRARELVNAEYGSMSHQQRDHQLRMLGVSEVRELPVHFKAVRVGRVTDMTVNDNVQIDLAVWQAQGYRFATVEDFTGNGFQLPPLYHVAADGKIRRGDVAMMVVDANTARAVREAKLAETKERELGGSTNGLTSGVPISVEMTRDPHFSL
jgi:hypothetical protein